MGQERPKNFPDVHAVRVMSELDIGLRGLIGVLPRIIKQYPAPAFGDSLKDQLDGLTLLRRGLHQLATQSGFRFIVLNCEDMDHLLNDLRALAIQAKYGRTRPSAAFSPVRKVWKAMMQRWDDLLATVPRFMDAQALRPFAEMHAEARRLESHCVDTMVSLGLQQQSR